MNMIVKYNPEGREDLPIELQEELADLETIIEDIMHGWNYCRHDFDWWEFDVSWEKGIWWLAMRERDEYGWSETRVDIQAGVRTRLEPCWSRMFIIGGQVYQELVVEDYSIDPERRSARFIGRGITDGKEFATQFNFSNTGATIWIVTEQWNPDGTITHAGCWFIESGR